MVVAYLDPLAWPRQGRKNDSSLFPLFIFIFELITRPPWSSFLHFGGWVDSIHPSDHSVPIVTIDSSASENPENSDKNSTSKIQDFSWRPSKIEQIQILNKKKPNADRGSEDANRSTPAPLLRPEAW